MQIPSLLLSIAFLCADPSPEFETDVLPILTKHGCNAGACHGAAAGRGGFKLSLFAGNPDGDYDAIVRELEGRRIDRSRPADSLLIAKPTQMLDHEGGLRFAFDGPQAQLLADWVAAGAARSKDKRLIGLEVEPAEGLVAKTPAEISICLTAQYSDGSKRNVTSLAVFTPADESALTIDESAIARLLRPGRHTLTVRFLSEVRSVTLLAPLGDQPKGAMNSSRNNWIDEEIDSLLAALRLSPASRADDATLLRRATLDMTGRLPTPQDVREYLTDTRADKFERLIDRLLASEAFVDYWTWQLARQFRVRTGPNDEAGTHAFHGWLRDCVRADQPLDAMAREMITASGDSVEHPAANFHRSAADARGEAEYFSEVFLGVRLACANCHNHPLDRWTQDDYHGLAAIFAPLSRGRNVQFLVSGEVIHPATGEAALARIPGSGLPLRGEKQQPDPSLPLHEDFRDELASWLVDKPNPHFSRAQVNRLWKALFGRGLVEPADDLRETNPATHPTLLTRLAEEFETAGYSLREMLKTIALSGSYQRAKPTNLTAPFDYYATYPSRPLDAEVLLDAIGDVTGIPETFTRDAVQPRAIQIVNPAEPAHALELLGRCSRQGSCDAATSRGTSLEQLTTQLHLLNGKLLNERLESPASWLARAIAAGETNQQVVEDLYLRALSRRPSPAERKFWEGEIGEDNSDPVRRQKLQDLLWAILVSPEFTANH